MTKKHLQFCIYYLQTGDQQVAYKMAYPHAAVKSLKASASRLMARPDVAEWVNGTEERVHNRMMRQFHSEHYDEFKEKLLTINEKRTVLTKIIKGETKRVRYVKVKYGVQKVEEDLSADTVLRAIDLDTRLENFYNYLTRSDTWRKTQNIYVNTPTLQQQVNILINQTAEKEETKDTQADIVSPRSGAPIAIGVGVHSRATPAQDTPEEPGITQETAFPLGRGTEGDVHSRRTDNTSPPLGDLGVYSRSTLSSPRRGEGQGVRSLGPKKTPRFLATKSMSSLKQKKDIDRLTTEPVPPNAGLTQKKDIDRLTTEPVPPNAGLTQKKRHQ